MTSRYDDDKEIHYRLGLEHERLSRGGSPTLEYVRTQELFKRFLPPPPGTVADVGGGTGVYAAPLARKGYTVHLVDAMDNHVETALAVAQAQPVHPFTAEVGDARHLVLPDNSFDAVLLAGPLYHLTSKADRLSALSEAARIARPGAPVLAVSISRFASLFGGLIDDALRDPVFRPIVERDLRDGQHRNPDPARYPQFFTTAHFALPAEFAAEIEEAGLRLDGLYAIEGPGVMVDWSEVSDSRREDILFAIRAVETEASLIGLSTHFMAVARR